MFVDKKVTKRIAHLARIEIKDEEIDKLSIELTNILKWMEKLKTVDIENITPQTSVSEMLMYEREDTKPKNTPEELLNNAPDQRAGYFAVPKVIE